MRIDASKIPLLHCNKLFVAWQRFFPFYVFEGIYMLTPEQLLAAQKANMEALHDLTTKAFESVERLVELNMTATKAMLDESAAHAQALLGARDMQELLALQASVFQPLAEKTAAYSRHLYDIAAGASANSARLWKPRWPSRKRSCLTWWKTPRKTPQPALKPPWP